MGRGQRPSRETQAAARGWGPRAPGGAKCLGRAGLDPEGSRRHRATSHRGRKHGNDQPTSTWWVCPARESVFRAWVARVAVTPRPARGAPLPSARAGGAAPGSQAHLGRRPHGGLLSERHQSRRPSQAAAPRLAGTSQPPTHTSRAPTEAKHVPRGPGAHWAMADRTCSKTAGR